MIKLKNTMIKSERFTAQQKHTGLARFRFAMVL